MAPSFMSSIFGPKRRLFTPYLNNQNAVLIERFKVTFQVKSDSSREIVKIGNEQIKTAQNNSYG